MDRSISVILNPNLSALSVSIIIHLQMQPNVHLTAQFDHSNANCSDHYDSQTAVDISSFESLFPFYFHVGIFGPCH